MAFSNMARHGDDRQAAAGKLAGDKSRTFSALARDSTPDSKSNSNALSINYGNGTTDWGPNSIWGNGSFGNGFGSRAATRENSRDGLRHAGQEEHNKGSLRPSGSRGIDDPWSRDWKVSAGRSTSQAGQADGQTSHPQRSASHATLPAFANGTSTSRPPAISINTTSVGASAGHRPANSNPTTSLTYEPPPTVYTKHDRHQDPNTRLYRDSVTAGTWNNVSPTDTRRPLPPSSRTVSQPMTRNNSQQHAVAGDERPAFTRPDFGNGQHRSTQNSSRAPSISGHGPFNFSTANDARLEQLQLQFGQLGMNGDTRSQTSYRSSDASFVNPYSTGISPLTRTSMSGSRPTFGAMEDADDFEGEVHQFTGFPNSLSPISTHFAGQGYGGRFPPTPTSGEFRPGQGFFNGQMATRGFDMSNGSKALADWQSFPNTVNAMQLSKPSFSAVEQPYLTPQMQQLFAAQLRQFGAVYNPYAVPNPLHLASMNPYLSMMPMSLPAVDPSTPMQEMTAGENIQSALLFEFKNNAKTKRYELRDIYEHIAEFSADQHGSRFIQTKLETANQDEKNKVFDEIAPNAIQLMTDVFGNYVIQKFFEHGDQVHKKILAAKMKNQVLALTNQMYGCRVVQKALDYVFVEQQAQIVAELEGHVLKCVRDQNGNHVIQKAIEKCPANTISFIINSFQGSVQQLSVNSYGCRVIQRCLEHCDKPAKAMIMAELMEGIEHMISDQYGNYVVQHVVERDDGEGRRHVLNIVSKHLEMFSKHKFASNVVEKCLEHADDLWRRGVLCKLSGDERRGPDGESLLVGMIKDNYGNYVIRESTFRLTACVRGGLTFSRQKNSSTPSSRWTTSPSSRSSSPPSPRPSAPAAASRSNPSSARWSASAARARPTSSCRHRTHTIPRRRVRVRRSTRRRRSSSDCRRRTPGLRAISPLPARRRRR